MGVVDGHWTGGISAAREHGAERQREREERLSLPEQERVRPGYQPCGCRHDAPHVDGCPIGIAIDSLLDMSARGLITWEELGDRIEALQAGDQPAPTGQARATRL